VVGLLERELEVLADALALQQQRHGLLRILDAKSLDVCIVDGHQLGVGVDHCGTRQLVAVHL